MPSFKIIGLPVLENIFKGFNHIWAWWPSWSCDLDHLYKLSFPLPKEAPHKWLWLVKRFREDVWKLWTMTTTTTTDAGAWVYYKLIYDCLRWASKECNSEFLLLGLNRQKNKFINLGNFYIITSKKYVILRWKKDTTKRRKHAAQRVTVAHLTLACKKKY